MNERELKKFLEEEIKEIEKHKWIESEKKKRDLGQEAIFDWIKRYAKEYKRDYYKKKNKRKK